MSLLADKALVSLNHKQLKGEKCMDEDLKIKSLEAKIKELEEVIDTTCPMLELQPTLEGPPATQKQLYDKAASGDTVTIDAWRKQWLDQAAENAKRFNVVANDAMSEYLKFLGKPCIVAGSGPSLRKNAKELRNRGFIGLVSCLHNFGFFVDNDVWPDYYLTLDAGDITIPEVYQGGTKDEEYYWAATEKCTLLASTVSNPRLIEKWRGKVLWFTAILPNKEMCDAHAAAVGGAVVPLSVGGNALGACMYFARVVLGACPISFVGADFCFSYRKKFHPFDSPYDQKFSGLMKVVDIYGNACATWPSYFNFANWFMFVACGSFTKSPQLFINCTEGGILGAYPDGNIKQIIQMKLVDFIGMYRLPEKLAEGIAESKRVGIPVVLF